MSDNISVLNIWDENQNKYVPFPAIKGNKGDKGDKGEAFTYEDFTPEQLESLKGENYILTETDKQEITAEVTSNIINSLETIIDESGVL